MQLDPATLLIRQVQRTPLAAGGQQSSGNENKECIAHGKAQEETGRWLLSAIQPLRGAMP